MADCLHLRLGGRPAAWWGDGSPVAFPTRKALALLVLLARHRPAPVPRGVLADLLWPGRGEEASLAGLRRTLYELRQALGPERAEIVRADRETLALAAGRVDTDAARIEAALADPATTRLPDADIPPDGAFLRGLEVGSDAFEDWCAAERARLADAALRAATLRAEAALEAGSAEAALPAAEAALALDPASEAGCRALMRALAALGRRAEALRRYAAFRAALAEDLDIDPDPDTEALAGHVRRAADALPDAPLPRPDRPSIAVLPFRDLTGEAGQAHLVDGLAGAITADLARDRALFVIADGSGRAYRDTPLAPREIAAELGIRYLLTGRVRLDRARLRLEVELVDAVAGAVAWTERYDRPRGDLLTVQDEITGRIVASLRGYKGVIQRRELDRARRLAPADLDAHDHLMRGMALKERFLREDMAEARRHFEQAIALSPQFAPAHGWLAWTWFFDVYMGWADDPAPALEQTFRAAREAVRLDPELDFAHWALGAAWMAAGEMERSLAAFERALELNPNNSDAMANRAWPLMFAGQPDAAVESLERAMRLNPFHPDWYLWGLGMAEYTRDAPEAAIAALSRMAQPNGQSLAFLAAAHHRTGEAPAARRVAESLKALEPGFTINGFLSPLQFSDKRIPDRLGTALGAAGLSSGA